MGKWEISAGWMAHCVQKGKISERGLFCLFCVFSFWFLATATAIRHTHSQKHREKKYNGVQGISNGAPFGQSKQEGEPLEN